MLSGENARSTNIIFLAAYRSACKGHGAFLYEVRFMRAVRTAKLLGN